MSKKTGYTATSTHLDFGCGGNPRNPLQAMELITVDVQIHSKQVPTHRIAPGAKLPFDNETFDSISAYDVLEHLSREAPNNLFIYYMNELHRVLRPGGTAVFVFPAFPHRDAFSDPTHVNFITSDTVNYFTNNLPRNTQPYEGILTNYSVVKNSRLRKWKRWVYDSQVYDIPSEKNLRRRVSLWKRTLFRAIFPQHRIWILIKNF
jgi:SAM-dependent methyltransferase